MFIVRELSYFTSNNLKHKYQKNAYKVFSSMMWRPVTTHNAKKFY